MEEQWFNKSTGSMDYIEIDESQLEVVLSGGDLTKTKKETDFIL